MRDTVGGGEELRQHCFKRWALLLIEQWRSEGPSFAASLLGLNAPPPHPALWSGHPAPTPSALSFPIHHIFQIVVSCILSHPLLLRQSLAPRFLMGPSFYLFEFMGMLSTAHQGGGTSTQPRKHIAFSDCVNKEGTDLLFP